MVIASVSVYSYSTSETAGCDRCAPCVRAILVRKFPRSYEKQGPHVCSVVVLLALVLAACSGKSHDAAPTTSAPPPPTTAATTQASPPASTAPNPDVIPPVITVAYVNAVFAVLNHLNGDAVSALVASRHVTPTVEAVSPCRISTIRCMQKRSGSPLESLMAPSDNVRQPPGDGVTTVERS